MNLTLRLHHQAPGLRSVPSTRRHPSSEPSRFAASLGIPPVPTFSHPPVTLYPRKRSCVTLIIIRFIPNSLLPLLAPIINCNILSTRFIIHLGSSPLLLGNGRVAFVLGRITSALRSRVCMLVSFHIRSSPVFFSFLILPLCTV